MGGRVLRDKDASRATHVVAGSVKRTIKFLSAMSQARHIVSPTWLAASAKAGRFVAEGNHVLRDRVMEKKFGFTVATALESRDARSGGRKRGGGVLAGVTVFATPSVRPPPKELAVVVEAAGGKFLRRMPPTGKAGLLLISCAADLGGPTGARLKRLKTTVHDREAVLRAALRQELRPEEDILWTPGS